MVSTIHQLLQERATFTGDGIAFAAAGKGPTTYCQLSEHVNKLAVFLTANRVGRQDSVAVVLPNGPALAVALLASMSVAAAAPLNPAYTDAELDYFFSDLEASALIVDDSGSLAAKVASRRGIPVVEWCDELSAPRGGTGYERDAQQVSPDARPADIALRLYISGTTAAPKRVPLSHGNLLASAGNIAATLQLSQRDRCLNSMPLYHVHGLVGALLASLTAGASVALPPLFEVGLFWQWLKELQPTWYTAVPTMHQAIAAHAADHQEIIANHSLRFIRSSSAALPARLLTKLEATFAAPVIEAYGMTEAAHQMASNPLPPVERKPGSVGRAAGSEIAIMDEAGGLLTAGERGEIVVRGANVMAGYGNNPAANANAFSAGWFRTGDEGYQDQDGHLFITGRLKERINKGGEKISPQEIDEALLDHPEVSQAVAFAVAHATLGEDVAAAVVLRPGCQLTESSLRQFVAQRLAAYKIPSRIVTLDELPIGATGKLQRIGLAEKLANVFLEPAPSGPEGDIESQLASIYAEVLGVQRVNRAENFFALGGDSLRRTGRIVNPFSTR
ncbi:MAG: AMP-binding protein [Deltaproteobacteria bacterium]|nr:AMP-binding protein [Deltaproteobacteria bacterium]